MSTLATHPNDSMKRSIRLIAADIKLAHSVFALPFALLAAFMAGTESAGGMEWNRFGGQLGLVISAMVLARTAAMIANRLLDRHIDRHNPRTANRAIPSGQLSAAHALVALLAAALLFIIVCAGFGILYANWWPLILSLPVLAWIAAYGWFKRFTSLCHVYLGSSLAISPIAAAIAIDPASLAHQPSIWLLAGMVLCWVAGFDIIYALQDVEVDRAQGLFSIPSRFGVTKALWLSRLLHAAAVACLVACVLLDGRFEMLFGIGVLVVSALLLYEHLTVSRWGTTRMALAFLTLNGIISCVLGTLGIFDVLIR